MMTATSRRISFVFTASTHDTTAPDGRISGIGQRREGPDQRTPQYEGVPPPPDDSRASRHSSGRGPSPQIIICRIFHAVRRRQSQEAAEATDKVRTSPSILRR